MGIFSNVFGGAESDERENALSGTNIAVARAEFRGSVHDGSDVTVTVETQYGERQSSAIDVAASVHGSGSEDVTVKKLVDFEKVPDEWELPTEGTRDGKPPSRRIDKHGDVHDYGRLNYNIDRLVILPDESGERGFRAEADRQLLTAFNNAGFDTAQELSVSGFVHDRGKLTVTIDHLVVMD